MIKYDLSQICRVGSTFENQLMKFIMSIDLKRKKKYMIISIDTEKAFDKI